MNTNPSINQNIDILTEQLKQIDLAQAQAEIPVTITIVSWLNNNLLTTGSISLVLDICQNTLKNDVIFKKTIEALEYMTNDEEQVEYNPGLKYLNSQIFNAVTNTEVVPSAPEELTLNIEINPTVSEVLTTNTEVVVSPAPEVLTTNTEAPTLSTVDTLIEDLALANGITIMSGEEWLNTKLQRTIPVLIKNFDFRHVGEPELGRAGYLLVAPNKNQDVRLELRSQNVSGSAGDKLPVIIRKFRRLQQVKEYGQTFIGIVGNINLFSEDSLSLAREEAVKSGRIIYAEGEDTVSESLNVMLTNTAQLFKPVISNTYDTTLNESI